MASISDLPRTVRPLAAADLPEAGRVLGRAFQHDPVLSWLFPNEKTRQRRLPILFGVLAREVHNKPGATTVAFDGDRMSGAALWDPPGAWWPAAPLANLAQSGFVRAIGGRAARLWSLTRAIDRVHPREPHWYLGQLGTDPDFRGHGAGRALVRYQLARCDEAGLPAYLESSHEANLGFYQRLGFEVRCEITPKGGPTLWSMRRPARPAA